MKKSFKFSLVLMLLYAMFLSGCSSKEVSEDISDEDLESVAQEVNDLLEDIESIGNEIQEEDIDDIIESIVPSESKDEVEQEEVAPQVKGEVTVTIVAPLVYEPLHRITADGLDSFVDSLSEYKKVDAPKVTITVSRGEDIYEVLSKVATELINNNTVIKDSATELLGMEASVTLNDLVLNGTYGDLETNGALRELEDGMTFADADVEDGTEMEVVAAYTVKNVAVGTAYNYTPSHIMASVPATEDTSTVYVLLGGLLEDSEVIAPTVEGYTAEWRISSAPEKYAATTYIDEALNSLWLQVNEYVAPMDRFEGEYVEKIFEIQAGVFATESIFTITYPGARPDVVIASPNGNIYTSSDTDKHENGSEYHTVTEIAGEIKIRVNEVTSGDWVIRVYKHDDNTVSVNWKSQ